MTSSTSDIGAGELRFSKMQLSFNHLSPGAIVQGKTTLSSKYYVLLSKVQQNINTGLENTPANG